jgi:hypothetical protein
MITACYESRSRQQYYCTAHVANSPSQGFYKLSKATNELQDARGLRRQVFRRGFFPPQGLAAPQDQEQVCTLLIKTQEQVCTLRAPARTKRFRSPP